MKAITGAPRPALLQCHGLTCPGGGGTAASPRRCTSRAARGHPHPRAIASPRVGLPLGPDRSSGLGHPRDRSRRAIAGIASRPPLLCHARAIGAWLLLQHGAIVCPRARVLAGSRERARTAMPITHYRFILTKEQPAATARFVWQSDRRPRRRRTSGLRWLRASDLARKDKRSWAAAPGWSDSEVLLGLNRSSQQCLSA